MSRLKILELFGGIGACSKALKNLNIDFEIVDYVEINQYAVKSFNAINNTNFNIQDIRSWDKAIDVDLIFHGSPCQDFSKNGKHRGGDEGSNTRSSLMYETLRIVEKLNPKFIIWENVENVLSHQHIHNFNNYINRLENLGYKNYYKVLNAKDFGIPHNRERVYVVSIRNNINKDFIFPNSEKLVLKLKDLLEKEVDNKYYLNPVDYNNICFDQIVNNCFKVKNATKKGYLEAFEGDSVNLAYPNSKTRRGRVGKEVSQTLQCSNNMGVVVRENEVLKIRKLTSKECWRLVGFNDEDFLKASQVNSDTQLYRQAGNSIVVNVLMAIFKNLFSEVLDVKI